MSKNWREWLEVYQSGDSTGKLEEHLAEKLASVVKIKVPKVGKFRNDANIIRASKLKKSLEEKAIDYANETYKNAQVSVIDIVEAMGGGIVSDRSIKALIQKIERVAVDDTAKKYWIDYMGDYGKLLTRDFVEVMKGQKVKVGKIIDWIEWFERSYGKNCIAVKVLSEVINGGTNNGVR